MRLDQFMGRTHESKQNNKRYDGRGGKNFGVAQKPLTNPNVDDRNVQPYSQKAVHDSLVGTLKSLVERSGQIPHETVVIFSNLAKTVATNDLQELCATIGELKDVQKPSGGSARVLFARKSDANACVAKYNGLTLDGLVMSVSLAEDAGKPVSVFDRLGTVVPSSIVPYVSSPPSRRRLKFHVGNIIGDVTDDYDVTTSTVIGQALCIDESPLVFQDRYGLDFPKFIYVRPCYTDMYELVSETMLSAVQCPSILLAGVSGIGKSVFMIYFIYRFGCDDRFGDKSFAFERMPGVYDVFRASSNSSQFTCTDSVALTLDEVSELLVLSDTNTGAEPAHLGKWTVVFSSPSDNQRFNNFIKKGPCCTFHMPTWSEQEFLVVKPDASIWYDRFAVCGGVARYVLWNGRGSDPMARLPALIIAKGAEVIDRFFSGTGFVNTDALIHTNPPVIDGKVIYMCDCPVYSFASDLIFQGLLESQKASLVTLVTSLFSAGADLACYKLGSFAAGYLFEKVCLWLIPLSGRTISSAVCLSSSDAVLTVTLPPMETLAYNWKTLNNHRAGVLYQPLTSNLESGNAFCLLRQDDTNEAYLLIVLHITIAASHPIKSGGLKAIVRSYPQTTREKIKRKVILFVTPSDGNLHTVQPICTKVGTEMSSDLPTESLGLSSGCTET